MSTHLVAVTAAALPALRVLQAAVRRTLCEPAVGLDIDALVVSYNAIISATPLPKTTTRTRQRNVVVSSVRDPELLLGNIHTLVQVQVGAILSSDDTEVEAEVLARRRVGCDLDLGRASGVGESLEVGVSVGRGHTLGAERCTVSGNARQRVHGTYMAIRPKFCRAPSITVKHPDTPLFDHRICCPAVLEGGGVVPLPPKVTRFQTWSTPVFPHP